MAGQKISPSEVSLESKVAFLRQPSAYPEPSYRVEAIETHMSWVFLTDRHAYKLKKPVCYDLLDFRTIESRRFFCDEEVRLNRRLAAKVYLGSVALSMDACGQLGLEGDGSAIDWLVKMHRLPVQHMLDYAIKNGAASANDMRRVAARLTEFYRRCPPIPINADAYRAALLSGIDRNHRELSQPRYRLSIDQVHRLCGSQRDVLNQCQGWFDDRVRAGRIVEGHGDLRPEHICLVPEVAIIDCLEFSCALRIVDIADELAFLALECERLGVSDLGNALLLSYSEASGDWPNAKLLSFYRCYRATLRALIAIRHLDEDQFRFSAEWRQRANAYLQLVQRHQAFMRSVTDSPA